MFAGQCLRRIFSVSVVVFALVSEYIEGSSWNKALEIYNGTGASIDLVEEGYAIQYYTNGSPSPTATINLTGTLVDGDVFVLAEPRASESILAQADLITGNVSHNGDDTIVLVKGEGLIIDVFGQIGFDPGLAWVGGGEPPISTLNSTLRRNGTIFAGDTDGSNPFDPSVEWVGFTQDTFNGLGTHTVVPIPPTVYLMGSGLVGLAGIRRRRLKK
jgi:predicted extracellular nuclease